MMFQYYTFQNFFILILLLKDKPTIETFPSNSNILGSSITLSYFYANSPNRDFTFTYIFDEDIRISKQNLGKLEKNLI